MSFYGNKILVQQNNTEGKLEESFIMAESVVYNEYLNYKQMLENASGKDAILESNVQLLCELSVQDIKAKIKELWEKFKNWVKSIWEKFFSKKAIVDKQSKSALKKAKESLAKAKSKKVNLESATFVTESKTTIEYFHYANADENIGNLKDALDKNFTDYMNSISSSFDSFIKTVESGNESAIKAKIVDLIDDSAEDRNWENITRVFISKDNYGDRIGAYCDTCEKAINKYEELLKKIDIDLSFLDQWHKEIDKDIDKYSKLSVGTGVNFEDPKVTAAVAKISSLYIKKCQKLVSFISDMEGGLVSYKIRFTNGLEEINKEIEDKLAKFLEEE